MKKTIILLAVVISTVLSVNAVSYTWNGSISSSWNLNNNWTPNTGRPGASDIAIINSITSNICTLESDLSINTITVSAGTLDLGGFKLTVTSANITGGNIRSGSIDAADFDDITNTIFSSTISLTKTGGSNNNCHGGNTFNGSTTIINNSTNWLEMANTSADDYNASVTFKQLGTGILYPAYYGLNTFSGDISTIGSLYPITFASSGGAFTRIVIDGTSTQTFRGDAAYKPIITNLTMSTSGSGELTLAVPVVISRDLLLTTGKINTDVSNILTLNDEDVTTNVGNNDSYVNGPLDCVLSNNSAKTITFPIGKGNDLRPVVLNLSHSSVTSYTYRAELFNSSANALTWSAPATISNVSNSHFWDIKRYATSNLTVEVPSTDLSGNQTVTLYYDANDGVSEPTSLTICKNTSEVSTSWIDIGGTGAVVTKGSVSSTSSPSAFNSFSRFTLGNKLGGTNVLPIELASFSATNCNKEVCLNWSTLSEKNNDYFSVERSKDGIVFETVVKIKGAGNSNSELNYSTVDASPYNETSYYRLKQTDYNGDFTYSKIKEVTLIGKDDLSLNVFPNPNNGTDYKFSINSRESQEVLVVVYDINGKESYSKVILTEGTGETVFAFDPLNNLSKGIYLISATSKQSNYHKKMIVQ